MLVSLPAESVLFAWSVEIVFRSLRVLFDLLIDSPAALVNTDRLLFLCAAVSIRCRRPIRSADWFARISISRRRTGRFCRSIRGRKSSRARHRSEASPLRSVAKTTAFICHSCDLFVLQFVDLGSTSPVSLVCQLLLKLSWLLSSSYSWFLTRFTGGDAPEHASLDLALRDRS